MNINTRVLSGFMELLPHEQIEFDKIKNIIENTYKQFGFSSINTPNIERSQILLAKGSSETDKQLYFVNNGMIDEKTQSDINELALRFDLTVPLSRYVAQHFSHLVFPFRCCHIGKVYRGERPQKGRFREFYQCDIDIIGKDKLDICYEAEILNIIYQIFKKLDIGKFTIRINNRKLLNGYFAIFGEKLTASILQIIDKAEKISKDELLRLFSNIELSKNEIDYILSFINIKGSTKDIIKTLENLQVDNKMFQEGLTELTTVVNFIEKFKVSNSYYTIDLSIVRGLDYYTGTVYETTLDNHNIGSICSGGRYDNLASHYTKEKLPGVGVSIGLTRLFWQLKENGLLKLNNSTYNIIVVTENQKAIGYAIEVADVLRKHNINTDVFYEDVPMKKKFQYINKKEASISIVIKNDTDFNTISLQYLNKDNDGYTKEIISLQGLPNKVKNLLCNFGGE